jgi:hypothetical protein
MPLLRSVFVVENLKFYLKIKKLEKWFWVDFLYFLEDMIARKRDIDEMILSITETSPFKNE